MGLPCHLERLGRQEQASRAVHCCSNIGVSTMRAAKEAGRATLKGRPIWFLVELAGVASVQEGGHPVAATNWWSSRSPQRPPATHGDRRQPQQAWGLSPPPRSVIAAEDHPSQPPCRGPGSSWRPPTEQWAAQRRWRPSCSTFRSPWTWRCLTARLMHFMAPALTRRCERMSGLLRLLFVRAGRSPWSLLSLTCAGAQSITRNTWPAVQASGNAAASSCRAVPACSPTRALPALLLQRSAAEAVLKAVQEHPEAWTRVDAILEHSKNQQTKFFGLQVGTRSAALPHNGSAWVAAGACRMRLLPGQHLQHAGAVVCRGRAQLQCCWAYASSMVGK